MASELDKIVLKFCVQSDIILARCLGEIEPKHFEYKAAGLVFDAMREYFLRSKKGITHRVLDEMLDDKELEAELQQECTDLFEEIEDEDDCNEKEFDHHLGKFKQAAIHRGWESIVERFTGEPARDYGLIKQEALPLFEADSTKQRAIRASVGTYADQFIKEYLEVEAHPEKAYGVLTGFDIIDQETYGMQPGELWLISGRHGSGKSVLLLNVAINAYRAGKKVLIFSLEMPLKQYMMRFNAGYNALPYKDLKGGKLNPAQFKVLKESNERMKEVAATGGADLWIVDLTQANALTIEAEIRRGMAQCNFKPDLIVIDYIGIMQSVKEGTADWQEQGFVAEELRKLARDFNIPFVTASQLNRDKKATGTSGISRSDIIGATVDVFLKIEEKDEEEANDMTLLDDSLWIFIGKCRDGQSQQSFQLYKDFSKMLVKNKDMGATPQERILGALNRLDDKDIIDEDPAKVANVIPTTVAPSGPENKQAQQSGDFIDAT